jgi:biopolymer transport protein ExbD
MAMSLAANRDSEPMVEMNTTPLIDVMLVLLIMFIITLPIMTHTTVLENPHGPGTPPPEVLNVSIDFDGTIVWNGTVLSGMDQFERYIRVEAAKDQQPELHVRADRRAAYDQVAHVLAIAQRSGLKHIGIVGNE